MSRKIDQFFKDGLKSISTPYQPKHWEEMSSILDDRNTSGRPGGLFWWVAGFIGVSFALFLWLPTNAGVVGNDSENFSAHIDGNRGDVRGLEINHVRSLSDVRSQKSKSHSFGLHANELKSYAVGNLVNKGRRMRIEGFSLSRSPENMNFGGYLPSSDLYDVAKGTEVASGSKTGVRLSAPSALDLLDLQLLLSGKFKSLSSVEVDDSPRFFAPLRWGIGATYGGQSFQDAGVFVELDIPLSRYLHLVFRPGLTYASLNESSFLIEQRMYDFGLKEREIEFDVHRELQWELPVFLMIENHRHHFGLGGGLRMDGLRRASKVESILSDKDRLENTEESGSITSRDDVWLNSSSQITPFVEGFYQYRLTPSWQAGLKSRIIIPSASTEGSLVENRVHYGVYITYLLN
jgi:hypothetical protein